MTPNEGARRTWLPSARSSQLRLVGAVRLSRYTDVSTSPEVQEGMVQETGDRLGGTFVGWARDTDVSALKTTPWEREELSAWLNQPDAWDAMIWQRMDRAVRSMADMADLGRYAKKHGKRLIFASGPGGERLELDFSSPMSELIMLILAFAAQLEGQTIMERNQGAAAHLQSLGRWPGGVVPYGWTPVRKIFKDGNEGWWLAADTATSEPDGTDREPTMPHLRSMIARAISGDSYSAVEEWLTRTAAITPKNHRARLADPPRPQDPTSRWRVTVVREILRSPILRGYIVKRDGTIVRDDSGAPILQAEPALDDSTWYTLQECLERLTREPSGTRRRDAHPMLGVVQCEVCERNMYTNWDVAADGTRLPTFRCNGVDHPTIPDAVTKGGRPKKVPALSIRQAPVMEFVDREFLRAFGSFRRTQLIKTGGVDHRQEIAELTDEVDELSGRLARLRGVAADAVERQLQARSDRLELLRCEPVIPPREEVVYLDRTWGDDWRAAEPGSAARREMLLSAGVRIIVKPPTGWRRPGEERLVFVAGAHDDPVAEALDAIRREEMEVD
ncbi:recombinase family protein [Kitasatospora sp. NPDC086009]|uniref:recombinase family protein n=1 Tax=unclassified Kitasatospora TaxID=2633591 RepID=UPI0037CC2823